jgi:hypothetical protein
LPEDMKWAQGYPRIADASARWASFFAARRLAQCIAEGASRPLYSGGDFKSIPVVAQVP